MSADIDWELAAQVAAGEDTFLEFLDVFAPQWDHPQLAATGLDAELAESFVAFANTGGGTAVLGVNQNGDIVGIDGANRNKLEQFVVRCALDHCVPQIEPTLDWLYLPGPDGAAHLCLKVYIPRARFYVHRTHDGRFLKRVARHRAPIPAKQLRRLLASNQILLPFEQRPVVGAGFCALNRTRFDSYHRARFGKSLSDGGLAYERLLANLKLAIQEEDKPWQPSNVGLLLFSDHPEVHLSGAYVDIAVYDHDAADGNTRDTKRITGPIPEQIEGVLTYLRSSPMIATVSSKNGLGRLDQPAYSEFALQEAIVNALAHRDYEVTESQVIVTLFSDRIEIRNPGGLHNTLTEENLYAGCQPVRRNQILAGFLRDYPSPITGRSYMEARGEGFLTLVRESLELSGRRPEIRNIGSAVKLTLFSAINGDAQSPYAREQ